MVVSIAQQVTFLYELREGSCPKSYGTACARLAGIPEPVLARAEALASTLEHGGAHDAGGPAQPAAGEGSGGTGLQADEGRWLTRLSTSLLEGGGAGGEVLRKLHEEARVLLAANTVEAH